MSTQIKPTREPWMLIGKIKESIGHLKAAQSREQFLAERKNVIGGSDAAVACGMSKYEHMLDLWTDKRGMDVEGKAEPEFGFRPMYWGNMLEDDLCDYYEQRTGLRVYRGELCEDGIYRLPLLIHPKYPWMAAHLDGIAIDDDGNPVEVLECKTAGWWMRDDWGEEGTESIPREYLIQCTHNLEVARAFFSNIGRAAVPVLLAGQEDRLYRVKYDPEFAEDIVALERVFSEQVQSGQEPDIDSSEAAKRYLDRRYPADTLPEVIATPEIDGIVERLAEVRQRLSLVEDEKRGCENEIKKFMAENAVLLAPDLDEKGRPRYKISWKKSADGEKTNWEAVCRALASHVDPGVYHDLVHEHTKTTEGSRRFTPSGSLFPRKKKE